MRKTFLLLASVALAIVLSWGATGSTPRTAAQASLAKPNFVFILADDMRKDDLRYMPKTRALLGDKGMSFVNAYVSYGLCCPSRATILRGQYTHNHEVWNNGNELNSTDGGWQGYKAHGNERDNLAVRLDNAGYRTGLFGKYFNHYKGTIEPPGWDDWFAMFSSTEANADYFDYQANDNGTIKHFGTDKSDYSTDVIRRQTRQFIDASVAQDKSFFGYVAPKAAHDVAIPAPRDQHAFDGEKAPRLPSFNEADVSDKPSWIRQLPRLSDRKKASINGRHERRVETLQALDDLVEGVVNKLRREGELDSTYVVFTSDNGWHHGEHRIPESKARPYEESIHMPLLIRGPGVQTGSTMSKLTLNTDFFPTFTDLAGIRTPSYVDGRSLRPLLRGSPTNWRTAILLEQAHYRNSDTWFYGIRTSEGRKYIEYEGGFRELYNLNANPYELVNTYDASTPPALLAKRLQALKACAGATCREAEDGR
jgi:N-acetylglucosamine-6-sulfatase